MDYTIKQGDNLSSIAARNNTTVANIQSANNISNPNLIKAGGILKIPNLPAGTVKTSPITSISNLTNGTQLQGNLVTTAPALPSTAPVTNLVLAEQALAATNGATSQLESNNTTYIDELKASLGMTENKQTDINAANEAQGVNANRKVIKEISDQILGGQTADQIQKLEKGKLGGLTVGGGQNIDNEINREAAVRNLSLGAKLSAAQGNLVLSQDLAEQAINTKYAPLEAKIANLKTYLDLNKDELTRVNAKAYKEQEILLNTKEKDLAETKKNESDKQNILINASSQGAPSSLVKRAQAAKTPGEAAMILGTYAGDYYKNEKLKSELNESKKLSLANNGFSSVPTGQLNKDIGVTIEDFKRGIAGVESQGSGDYLAIGPVITSGLYKGDKAYGKYQVMGKNLPGWLKQAGLANMTPQQFINNPDAQEKVFENQSETAYSKYGNWDDVASVWFSGKPLAGNKASDGYNTVPEYIAKMRSKMQPNTTNNVANLNLDKTQMTQYNDILNEVNAQTKNDFETIKFGNSIKGTAAEAKLGNKQAQIAVIFNFMKALDPTSTVRETEFSLIQNAQSAPAAYQQAITKFGTGQSLDSAMIDEMIAVAQDRSVSAKNNVNNVLKDAELRASQFKIPKNSITSLYNNRLGGADTNVVSNNPLNNFVNTIDKVYSGSTAPNLIDYSKTFTRTQN